MVEGEVALRAGDVVRCRSCGYTYTFRQAESAPSDAGCRRCARRALERWRG